MSPSKKKRPVRKSAKTEAPDAEISFEDALLRLEELVERLEEGDVPLEESLAHYAEGTRLVRLCQERLDRAETLIRELTETAEGFRLKPSSLGGDGSGEDDEDEDEDEDEGNGDSRSGEFDF